MTKKFKKISKVDSTFGTGKFAAEYDEQGDHKLRYQNIVQKVYLDTLFFVEMLIFRYLRDFGLRAAIEPSQLYWHDVKIKTVTDRNDEFFGRKQVDLRNLLRKGDELSLRNTTKQNEELKPDMVENPNNPLCVVTYKGCG